MPARRTFTREYKAEAVRAAERSGNAAQTARDLGIRPALIHRWKRELRHDGHRAFSGNGPPRDGARRAQTREQAAARGERDPGAAIGPRQKAVGWAGDRPPVASPSR